MPESSLPSETQGNLLTVSPCKIKKQITCFNIQWQRMHSPIPRRKNGGIVGTTRPKPDHKPAGQIQFYSIMSDVWGLNSKGLRWLSAVSFAAAAYISLLGQYHSLYIALLGKCLTAVASPASWGLQ